MLEFRAVAHFNHEHAVLLVRADLDRVDDFEQRQFGAGPDTHERPVEAACTAPADMTERMMSGLASSVPGAMSTTRAALHQGCVEAQRGVARAEAFCGPEPLDKGRVA